MSKLPAMPMWWSDFFAKTDHLSNEEQWAYAKLLAKTWLRNGQPFPDEPTDMARLLNIGVKRWIRIRERIAPFFDLSDGRWRQERLEKEFRYITQRKDVSRSNGAKGGRPKINEIKDIENPVGSSQDKQTGSTHTHTHTHTHKKKDSAYAESRASRVLDFETWWSIYPHKVGKGDAKKAFMGNRANGFSGAITKASLATLIDGVKRYETNRPSDRPWCNPGTWLRQERWTDEPGEVRDRKGPGDNLFEGAWRAAEAFAERGGTGDETS